MLDAGFVVDAVDASDAMVRVAAQVNNVTVRLGTFDDITQVADYDGIWANFSGVYGICRSLKFACKSVFARISI